MKPAIAALLMFTALISVASTQGQDAKKGKKLFFFRYGLDAKLILFPQSSPKEAAASIVKALSDERFEYLMAHLADPGYVDPKVEFYKLDYPAGNEQGRTLLAFRRLVRETTDHFYEDAELIQELRRFSREAEWKIDGDVAVGEVKDLVGRQVILRQLEGRWFLKNR